MGFYEEVLKEYEKITKRKSWNKDVYLRTRLVRRKGEDGIPRLFVDIREYIVTNKRAMFTEGGIYLTKDELDFLINLLLQIKKEFYNAGTKPGSGAENTGNVKEKGKLP